MLEPLSSFRVPRIVPGFSTLNPSSAMFALRCHRSPLHRPILISAFLCVCVPLLVSGVSAYSPSSVSAWSTTPSDPSVRLTSQAGLTFTSDACATGTAAGTTRTEHHIHPTPAPRRLRCSTDRVVSIQLPPTQSTQCHCLLSTTPTAVRATTCGYCYVVHASADHIV